MPVACPYSSDELQEKINECTRAYNVIRQQFEDAREKKELQHQDLTEVTQKYENIEKKVDHKTQERDGMIEKINHEQSEYQQLQQQQMPRLTKKYTQLNEDIRRCQEQLDDLKKNQPKVREYMIDILLDKREIFLLENKNHNQSFSPRGSTRTRCNQSFSQIERRHVCHISVLVRFPNHRLISLEKRRQVIEEYKSKRDHAQNYKKICDQCTRQVQVNLLFVFLS